MRGRPRQFAPPEKKLRINDKIRTAEVRLIAEDGEQLGVVSTLKARDLARERELDLVEVSPNAVPPVCKLMNFGKYTYQQSKKAQDARRHQTKIQVKEVKFRPKIDEHDYNFKKNHVLRFLKHGDKVKTTIMFRGREIVHIDYGRRILERLRDEIQDQAIVEIAPKQEGNTMSMILSPRKAPTESRPERRPARSSNEEPPKDKEGTATTT